MCLPIVLLVTLALTLHYSHIKPFQRGFFCNDHSLKYPYIENQTVPQYICLLVWILISVFIILFTQILLKSFSLQVIKEMITGALCCILLTDIVKYSVGRLRPHFLSLCNPEYNTICFNEDAYYNDGEEEFINDYYQKYVNETQVCNNEKTQLLKEARLSFLSGHTSFSFYCATFLIIYMNVKTKLVKWVSKIVPYSQMLLVVLATWIGLTRISDYYHHPIDVFCGAITGIVVGLSFHKNINTYHTQKDAQHLSPCVDIDSTPTSRDA